MALRFFGTDGLRALIAKNVGLAHRLHALVRDHPDFEVLHEPALSLYCFRYVPHDLADRRHEPEVAPLLDRLNDAIARDVQASGLAFFMTTRIRGRVALRLSIASQRTEAEDVDRTFEAIAAAGARKRRER
jgi:glutamate/tyrosine decarboxylase-like PLP-dependent enzyme